MWSCELVEQRGRSPGRVCRQTCNIVDGKVYIYGGSPDESELPDDEDPHNVNNQMFSFDLSRGEWTMFKNNEGDLGQIIAGHTSCFWKHHLYIFSGLGSFQYFMSGSRPKLWRFCLKKKLWKRITYIGDAIQLFGHTSVIYSGCMWVFGGGVDHNYGDESQTNRLWKYDFESQVFAEVVCDNSLVEPREGHCARAYRNVMYSFGGRSKTNRFSQMLTYNFGTNLWNIVKCNGTIPSPRAASTMEIYKDFAYIFGGYDGNIELNELLEFYIPTNTWKEILYFGWVPNPIGLHSSCLYVSGGSIQMLLYGGISGSRLTDVSYKDLYFLKKSVPLFSSLRSLSYFDVDIVTLG